MDKICTKCERPLKDGDAYSFAKDGIICGECLDAAAEASQRCPNCGFEINIETESVGLLLTPVGATPEQKKNAVETLVIVCPNCRILFFDEYHYKLLEGLRRIEPK